MAKKDKKSDSFVEVTVPGNVTNVITPVAIILSAIMVSVSLIYVGSNSTETETTPEDTLGETIVNPEEEVPTAVDNAPGDIVGEYETFTEYDLEVCKTDGKPEVYLFITSWCPHCTWISDTFDDWAKENADKITAYNWEVDTNDNSLTDEVETEIPEEHYAVYEKFNPQGSIPTFVFGCRYARVGNGYESEDNLTKEVESFNKILDEII
ncbi:MAG: thioredoxin family protein [Patescibacteria group bacterium]|nr:thioredoxin family protein [Patescibacteria group bacterium]